MTDKNEGLPLLDIIDSSDAQPVDAVPRKTEEKRPEDIQKKKEENTDGPVTSKPPTYEEGLKEAGIDLLEARQIMEHLATHDYYEETYHIGSLSLKLRTRLYRDVVCTQQLIEEQNPTYNMTVSELSARYNLAASLGALGERKFEFLSYDTDEEAAEELFTKKLRFVMGRPGPIAFKMMRLLHTFDSKIAAVFADGSPEDF